jgi:hypothetical protein
MKATAWFSTIHKFVLLLGYAALMAVLAGLT